MRISIVIPARNEGPVIREFLQHLRNRAPGAELILVDGNSSDSTAEQGREWCDQFLTAAPNRARQMNLGASAARGDVLWFLHADAQVPSNAAVEIEKALLGTARPLDGGRVRQVAGGFFRIRLPRKSFAYRLTDGFAHHVGVLMRMRCGDHGFFCRRDVFEKIGGFPEVELMEDVDFFRNLRRAGRVVIIPDRIVVSPRRYEMVGPLRLTLAFGFIGFLYFLRIPRPILRHIYERACCREVACDGGRPASY
jgi:rSAM/selenodomain-associated transferase 2